MKSSLFISALFVAVALSAVSCGPTSFMVDVEMRRPSRSGLLLSGKTISVVYNDSENTADSVFTASLSGGFAEGLENDYFEGEEAVGLYVRNSSEAVDKEEMVDLLVNSESDVLFLVDAESLSPLTHSAAQKVVVAASPDSSYIVEGTVSIAVKIYVYDGMDARDTVLVYKGSGERNPIAYVSGGENEEEILTKLSQSLGNEGYQVGKACSEMFKSSWKEENLTFVVYLGNSSWEKAAYCVYDYQWEAAMEQWMSMLGTKNLLKRSCLEYNIAVACYVLGKNDLAAEWLERSDKDYHLSMSPSMKRRIYEAK